MHAFIFWTCFFTYMCISLVKGDCDTGCDLPINIYEQLKCTPKYEKPTDCCPKEYDCSNIFKRPEGTCHLRGKLYKPGEFVSSQDIAETCYPDYCRCEENLLFSCMPPRKICPEYHVSDYPKDGCYLAYAVDSCCASDEVCPPFDKVAKCEVNGKMYKEGQRFPHPEAKCTKCVCSKGFDGKFAEPACQKENCTTEMEYSEEIDKHCAPYYITGNCCPSWWICPSEEGEYIAAPKIEKPGLQCKFGEKLMDIGSKYLYQSQHTSKLICECTVPPFLSCFEEKGE